jgi:hypothetical protein
MTIEHHHERWDGSGYPAGLAGTEISLGARIVSVADAYDVMVSGRSYQQKFSHSEARAELARHSGTQFDPRVVRALMEISIGKLRWITGPLAGLADLPLIRPLQALSRDVATVVAAGAITVAAGSGLIPISNLDLSPDRFGPPVDRTVDGELAAGPGSAGSGPTAQGGGQPQITTTTDIPTLGATTTSVVDPTTTRPSTTTSPTTTSPPATSAPTTASTTTTTTPGPLVANDDQAATRPSEKANIGVLDNDSGAYDRSSLQILLGPSSGTAVVGGGGRIRYTADASFVGTVTFTYQVCTSGGSCDTATVTVSIS